MATANIALGPAPARGSSPMLGSLNLSLSLSAHGLAPPCSGAGSSVSSCRFCCCCSGGWAASGVSSSGRLELGFSVDVRSRRARSRRSHPLVWDGAAVVAGVDLDSRECKVRRRRWSRVNLASSGRRRKSRWGAATDEAVLPLQNGQRRGAHMDALEEIGMPQLLGQNFPRQEEIEGSSSGEAQALPLRNGRQVPEPVETTDIGSAVGADVSGSPASSTLLFSRSKEESQIVRTAWEKLVRWSKSWQLLQARRQANALQDTKKVVILGGGSFGTAMAVLLARNKAEMEVTLLLRDSLVCQSINERHVNSRYFPDHRLPINVRATTDAKAALEGAQYCIHAVPVQSSATFLRSISEFVPPSLPILSVSKGLELETMEMMSQVIPRALGNPRQPVAVLSGPSFSIELMNELPTGLVAASKDKDLAKAAQQLLASRYLRVNTSSDVVGVEMAGALKNVLAIAAGIVEGMNLGNNCMAALVAQGCAEIRWLAEKMGAKSATLAGLSGTGDIMLTCFVKLSRNRSVGVRLGAGEKLEDILATMSQVAEGVATAGAVIALARKYRVQMPVLTAVARILENELTPKKAVLALMSLPQVEEV